MVKLRNWQIELVLPAGSAILTAPEATIVTLKNHVGIFRIDPHVVKIAVRIRHEAEALAAIHAQQKAEVNLEYFVLVLGVNNQITEIKRPPNHVLAGIELNPVLAAVIGAKQGALFAFDHGVNHLRLGGRNRDSDPSVRLVGKALGIAG